MRCTKKWWRRRRSRRGRSGRWSAARERCRPPSLDARTQALTQALAQARAAGPAALREAAARLAVQLDPGDVAELLAAELRGELGLDIVDLDELRGWIGESAAADVVAAADARVSQLARDYVRLRLAQLGPGYELPGDDAARSTASTVIRLLDAADDDPGAAAMSWRVFVLLGDLPSAEMALTGSLGGRAAPGRAAAVADDLARETAGERGADKADAKRGPAGGKKVSGGTGKATAPAGAEKLSGGTGEATAPAGAAKVSGGTGEATGPAGAAKVSGGTGEATGPAGVAKLPGGTGEASSPAGVAKMSGGTGESSSPAGVAKLSGGTGEAASPAGAAKLSGGTGEATGPAGDAKLSGGTAGSAGRSEPAASGPAQRSVPPPALWSARAAVDASTLPRLLQLARLRGAAGRRDQALAIAAWGLAEGQARGLPAIAELAAAEARHELAAGRPWGRWPWPRWSAARRPTTSCGRPARRSCSSGRPAASAAATPTIARRSCRCSERHGLRSRSDAPPSRPTRAPAGPRGAACPLLAESLAPGASGALAETLRRARVEGLGAPELGDALRGAIEADLTLDCAGRVAVPLMYAADTRVAVEALADTLAHVPQEVAAGQLALQSELALVLGRRDHADQLAQAAAAASADPRAVWRRAARMAGWIDARHYELLSLRQLLLHGVEGAEAEDVRLRLTVRAVRDANDAWAPRQAEAGREALIRGVESYLAEVPPARRWHAREALALALAEYAWTDEQAAALVRAALWPELAVVLTHPAGFRRIERAFGGDVPGVTAPALAPAQLAAELAPLTPLGDPRLAVGKDMSKGQGAQGPVDKGMAKGAGAPGHGAKDRTDGSAAAGAAPLPVEAEAFCGVDAMQPARLAALRGLSGQARVRAAAALATTGDAATRKEALQQLVAGLDPGRRGAVLDAVIVGLAAAPGRGAEAMVVSDDDLLAIVFGLVREPARQPREIKGQDG
ncbi:hypothetical protein OV079_14140 [Nannocystis pusilla]|uniref:Uncharacterized protein n=1 Tax=Nannocystis pusilla TaxID=889268 RepID=A0A9X3ENU3_9BACT|nr:hypothetical protein [Nannocystis pusilla]MCY1006669.1 hypothetical protein [Nannocystis pusilla]